jgi:hypothetical protein
VLLGVGLRNIVLLFCVVGGGFEEYSVAYCCFVLCCVVLCCFVLFCCFVVCLLDVCWMLMSTKIEEEVGCRGVEKVGVVLV